MFLKVTGMQRRNNLSALGETYTTVLRRRLISEYGHDAGMIFYRSFLEGLTTVSDFAELLGRVMGPMLG